MRLSRAWVALALAAAAQAAAPGLATAREGRALPGGRTLRRETARTRAVLKVRRVELPAAAHEERRVEVREASRTLVRRVTEDGPVAEGRFVRTTRTLTLEARGDGRPPWRAPPGDRRPRWSRRDAPHLFTSKRLGPIVERDRIRLRLFAPHARAVELVLDDRGERRPMTPDRAGVWEGVLPEEPAKLFGQRYHFEADGRPLSDPYAHATAGDNGPARLVDLRFDWKDAGFHPTPGSEQVVVEAHVKDMTASPSSPVDPQARGTYAGLAAPAVTAHYKELGATTLELLPIHEYDDRSGEGGRTNHWGYMTTHFFAPERRYAGVGTEAPRELQRAVDALHRSGRSVVMDVVYNHTNGGELHFKVLGRDLYYRLRPDGSDHDGAGTGNELATERPMVRKLVVDSLRHFVEHYHVDGFRFDLGSLLDPVTMRTIDRAMPARVTFLTAEPWAADWARARWGKGALAGTRFSVWNDDFRTAVNDFVVGRGDRAKVMTAVAGSVRPYGFAARPQESLNYLESHDELTLADRVGGDRRRDLLGAVLLLTSQGIPMLGHGQEVMRSKGGRANTYDQDNEINWLDWGLKQRNGDVFAAYRKLIALRQRLPHFRYERALTERDIEWLTPPNERALGYLLHPPPGARGRAAREDVLVLTNSDPDAWVTFELPRPGAWTVELDGDVEDGRVDARPARSAAGHYALPPGTAVILSQPRPATP